MTRNYFKGQLNIISLAASLGISAFNKHTRFESSRFSTTFCQDDGFQLNCSGHNPPEPTSKRPPCTWPSCDTVIARTGTSGSVVNKSFSQMVHLITVGKRDSDPAVAKLIMSINDYDLDFWRRALTEAYVRQPDRHSILQSMFEFGMENSAREALKKFVLQDELLQCVNGKAENLLHLAVRSGNISMVHILGNSLKHRFVYLVNHRRFDGMTPGELAGSMNKDDMNNVIAYHRNSYSSITKSEEDSVRGFHCHHHCHCCHHAPTVKPASFEVPSTKPADATLAPPPENLHVMVPVEKKVVGRVIRQVGEVFEVHPKQGYCERLYGSPQKTFVDFQSYTL